MKQNENGLYTDGDIYDSIHGHFTADIAFYEKVLPKDGKILEVGVGTGRIAIPLLKKGFNIEGLDPSTEMLKKAEKKLTSEGMTMPLYLGDARSFKNEEKFDAIFFGGNGLLHLSTPEDFDAFFEAARNLLKKDGFLVIDVFNPDFRFLKTVIESEASIGKITHEGKSIEIKEQSYYDRTTQVNNVIWNFYSETKNKIGERRFSQRILFPKELQYILKANSFTIENLWGDLSFGEFTQGSSRQVYKCQPQ